MYQPACCRGRDTLPLPGRNSLNRSTQPIARVVLGISLIWACPIAAKAESDIERRRETSIRAGGRQTIVAVTHRDSSTAARSAGVPAVLEFPKPPLVGFSPLIAIATSDKRELSTADLAFEHQVESRYVGAPLNFPASQNFVIEQEKVSGRFIWCREKSGVGLAEQFIPPPYLVRPTQRHDYGPA